MDRELPAHSQKTIEPHGPNAPAVQELSDKYITLPNVVTAVGGLCSLYGIRNADTIKGITALIVGELSDKVDGTLARHLNQQSKLGIKLDPIRDKMVTTAALLKILEDGLASKAVVASMATLEATKAVATLIAEYKHRQLPEQTEPLRPTQAGRISGALAAATTSLYILSDSAESFGHKRTAHTLHRLGNASFVAHTIVATVAAAEYVKRAVKLSKRVNERNADHHGNRTNGE